MKMSGNSYFLMIIMVIMLVVIGLSLGMENIKTKFLPLLIGGTVFVLAAIGLMKEMRAQRKPVARVTRDKTGGMEEDRKGILGYLPIGAWVVGFFLAIYLVGFITAIPLFVLAYMKSHGIRWLVAITSTAVTTAIVYGVFQLALRIDLHPGLISTWFGS